MSQFFDYFVCDEPSMLEWGDAFVANDEETLETIESKMLGFQRPSLIAADMISVD